mgnify:CR=1 FL=1
MHDPRTDRGGQAAESDGWRTSRDWQLGRCEERVGRRRPEGLLPRVRQHRRTRGTSLLLRFPAALTRSQIPFTCIQFPMYERFKLILARRRTASGEVRDLAATDAAMCGSVAGGIAAGITTPLDVCKTRIMLSGRSVVRPPLPFSHRSSDPSFAARRRRPSASLVPLVAA